MVALSDNQHFNLFTGSVGKHYGASYLLVCLTGVNAQTNVKFDGFVEVSFCGFDYFCNCFVKFVSLAYVNVFDTVEIFLSCHNAPP